MELLVSVLKLITTDCFNGSLALTDVYHSTPVNQEHKKTWRHIGRTNCTTFWCYHVSYAVAPENSKSL